jgi:hypothetical protein
MPEKKELGLVNKLLSYVLIFIALPLPFLSKIKLCFLRQNFEFFFKIFFKL